MQTQTQNYSAITDAALEALTDVRVWPDDIPIGYGGDQGDLLMWRIKESDIEGMEEVFGVVQLAPGTSQGSRHCLENPGAWRVFKPKSFGQFVNTGSRRAPKGHIMGYALLPSARERIMHPEHAAHSINCPIQTGGQVDSRKLEWAKD